MSLESGENEQLGQRLGGEWDAERFDCSDVTADGLERQRWIIECG